MIASLKLGLVGGGGWLGNAIVQSMLENGAVRPDQLTISYRTTRPVLPEDVYLTTDSQELAERSDVILLCQRPNDWHDLSLDVDGKLLISVMAGVTIDKLSERHNTVRVVRSLPNAAAEVGRSYTPWLASAAVSEDDRAVVKSIFDACGKQDEVAKEHDIDYLTALSGGGPAFPALLAAAMMNDAVAYGLTPQIAKHAVNAVLEGAGRLVEIHDTCPSETVELFRAYKGTTAAAINTMEANGFASSVSAGIRAGFQKSIDIAKPL